LWCSADGVTMAVMIIAVVLATVALVALIAAVIDNRRLGGRWFAGRRRDGDLRFHAPDPHGPLSPADRDAWFGGGSGHS
jgi:hypothetical protein